MTAPETYLKTQQVADALGVSASTIKRWVDSGSIEATRTMGKHRLVALSSALRFARQESYPLDSLLAITSPARILQIDDRMVESLVEALREGRSSDVRELISSASGIQGGAVALADRLIRPAMERVGHGWLLGSWDVYHEHQATLLVASAVTDLIARASTGRPGSKPLALGAAISGDPYVLPVLLGELVIREIGWDVKNLGNDLPLRSMAGAIREYRPRLVFLSASHVADRARFIADYADLYEAAKQFGSAVMLGGRGLDDELRTHLVCAGFGERMAHLAEFARRLLPATGATPDSAPNR